MSDSQAPGALPVPAYGERLQQISQIFTQARYTVSADGVAAGEHQHRSAKTAGVSITWARPSDPMWYWQRNNVPYNIWEDPQGLEIERARALARVLYVTHPLLGACIDVFTRYPLSGMEIVCPKDKALAGFYTDLFMDDLDYESFLVDVGREYWLCGEAFPLASFNEISGVWDSDGLQLPNDVEVIKTPFSNEPRFLMALPYDIRKILNERAPEYEYRQIVEHYPEFLALNFSEFGPVGHRDERYLMPVSNDLLAHVKRKGDSFHPRGIPLLMRAFRAVAQEEMLNAAQDSISQRLYTPLILARIGASATDLGTTTPWVPTQGDLDAFMEDVNAALMADFRMIATHFAVNMQNVFGRESMPNLSSDFTRLEDRMLMAFGLSRTAIAGASGGQTYAADALSMEVTSQLLTEYQREHRKLFRRRAAIVAEAQGHYDFERKGGRVKPIMERIKEVDPETGEIRFSERPKLLIPELKIRSMNLRSEEQRESFLANLRDRGVPISQRTQLVNVDIDLDDEAEAVIEEQVDQAVKAQRVRKETYVRLRREGLPIPEDLRKDFEPRVMQPGEVVGEPVEAEPTVPIDTLGTTAPDTSALVPTDEEDDVATEEQPEPPERMNRTRPPESDERRADMPKAAQMRKAAYREVWDVIEAQPDPRARTAALEALGMEFREFEDAIPDAENPDVMTATIDSRPVIGSFGLRHVGRRSIGYFYRADEMAPDDQAGPASLS